MVNMNSFKRLYTTFLSVYLIFILSCGEALADVKSTVLDKGPYGKVEVMPFSNSWLEDYPNVLNHVIAEHVLHVKGLDEKGEGLNWHKEKFVTTGGMDPQFNPEALFPGAKQVGIQIKLPYFIIPKEDMNAIEAKSLLPKIKDEVVVSDGNKQVVAYRFFVHPEAFKQFEVLFTIPTIKYVSPTDSEFIATPSSSYRSMVVRKVIKDDKGEYKPAPNSIPYIVKVGVSGEVLGSDRWLSVGEIERSVAVQNALDNMPESTFTGNGMKMYFFEESMGYYIPENKIEGYPPKGSSKNSGILIRQFPKELLDNKVQIFSFGSLMSTERLKPENAGVGYSDKKDPDLNRLPLIFEVLHANIASKQIKSTKEFFEKYMINGYLGAIEGVQFKEGLTIEPHSQNLNLVVDNNLKPIGFAYRDHGGVRIDFTSRALRDQDIFQFESKNASKAKTFKTKQVVSNSYIVAHSWFYRYQVFNKLLYAVSYPEKKSEKSELLPPPRSAPYQIGFDKPIKERLLYQYYLNQLKDLPPKEYDNTVTQMHNLMIGSDNINKLSYELDQKYMKMMDKYFDLKKVNIVLVDDMLPSAEGGSSNEGITAKHDGFLGHQRQTKDFPKEKHLPIANLPKSILEKIDEELVARHDKDKFADLKVVTFVLDKQGIWFFDENKAIVGFYPYADRDAVKKLEQEVQNPKP